MKFRKIVKGLLPPVLLDFLYSIGSAWGFRAFKKYVNGNIELQNVHSGQRCFLLGSGPSIAKEDLTVLKNEIVFALNNFYVHSDFAEIVSGSGEKYYLVAPIHPPQTDSEWLAWLTDMEANIPSHVIMIFGLNSAQTTSRDLIERHGLFDRHKVYWYYADRRFAMQYNFGNSRGIDPAGNLIGAETVSIYSLIFARYMGFKKVILLGMDHDYFLYEKESQMRMYDSAIHQDNEFERTFGGKFFTEELLRQYVIMKKYQFIADNSECNITNATDGGILRVFPRASLKQCLESTGG